jgi:hypothetical protein
VTLGAPRTWATPLGVRCRHRTTVPAALAALALAAAAAQGQEPIVRVYYLNVASASGHSASGADGASDFQRLRLMFSPATSPFRLDVAYEHTLVYARDASAALSALTAGSQASSINWLTLDWPVGVHLPSNYRWRHGLDRLNGTLTVGRAELRVGRQAISWATTLFLTPADPFSPLDPSDPFREYRGGVDAARLQLFPSAFSAVDVVVRPERTLVGRTLTALARGKLSAGGWDVSAWGGVLHDRTAAAAAVTRTLAGAALRGEIAVHRDSGSGTAVRFAVGADRRWSVLRRDLYVVAEYQHDDYGAARAGDLATVAASLPSLRGEMQVAGRDVAAIQATYQVHPLVSLALLALADLRDGSVLLGPGLTYSASDAVGVRAGAYLGTGRGPDPLGVPRSEFGGVPRTGYIALTAFF